MKKKIKAILIDDEPHALNTLKYELNRHCSEIDVIAEFQDHVKAEQFMSMNEFDVLFLDINLMGISGIDFLESLLPVEFHVIFVTAYDEYAIKAFDLSAIHYLMKPVNGQKLRVAVDKLIEAQKKGMNNKDFERLAENLRREINRANKIPISVFEGIEFIDPQEIIFIKGEGNYSTFYMEGNKSLVLSKTLKYIEEQFLDSSFLRIHKSYIINISKLKRFNRTDGGTVELEENHSIPVSRMKKQLLSELFR